MTTQTNLPGIEVPSPSQSKVQAAVMKEGVIPPSFRESDPDTCIAAAIDASRCAKGYRLQVIKLLARYPMTDYELAAITQMQQNSIGKRRSECYHAGLVEKHKVEGEVVKRPAPSGSLAIVWRLSEAGERFLKGQP